MIDLYTSATPNGQKIHIMLEECGLDYRVTWIDIDKGDQFDPAFLEISPNNKVPALVDEDGPDGEAIALKRLEFDPTTPVCIDCARGSGG